MSETFRDEAALRGFLEIAWVGDKPEHEEGEDGSFIQTFEDGPWKIVDTFFASEDGRLLTGTEVVSLGDRDVWSVDSELTLLGDLGISRPALGFIASQGALNPIPDFPLMPADGSEDETYRFEYESLGGSPLSLARFEVQQTVLHKPTNSVVVGAIIDGGWIDYSSD